jgi:hypothetical protein
METNDTVRTDTQDCSMFGGGSAAVAKSILDKTHYGLTIYSHILRLYYPDEVILRLVGRDCGLCRNPFNSNKKTLHIFIDKEKIIGNSRDKEYARHTDSENAIPAGDAFDFAALHYKQQGDELLQTLNKERNLHIGEERNRYNCTSQTSSLLRSSGLTLFRSPFSTFSFFKSPITNTSPHNTVTLLQIYIVITGNYYKQRTDHLRKITDSKQARQFKAANFDYCTFSGTFTTRNDKALIKHSGLLCIDFDHLNNVEVLSNSLLKDDYFDTQLLFRSPSGNGLKWIIPIDTNQATHSEYFTAVANYIRQTYGIEVDKSGRDLSRACFLPYDPQAYINPSILQSFNP